MRLIERVYLLATLMTIAVMFLCIKYANPLVRPVLAGIPLAESAATLLVSFPVYRTLSSLLSGVLRSWAWLRRRVLGPESLEGTWVGCIRREPREYTVELFKQKDGLLEVTGDSYLEDGTPRAHWESKSARVDIAGRRLVYAYSCSIEGVAHDHEGVASFRLEWDGVSDSGPPNRLEGYSADLTDGERDANTEFKVSNDWLEKYAALEKARAKFRRAPNAAAQADV